MTFVSEQLGDADDLSAFTCGEQGLDDWLQRSARAAANRHTGRTFVWHAGNQVVVAYYTLVAHSIATEAAPRSIGRGTRSEIPAILLARLAVDKSLQGQGQGKRLLGDALRRAAEASSIAAARVVVVDALNDNAVKFYRHFGFVETPVPGRLLMKVSTVIEGLR